MKSDPLRLQLRTELRQLRRGWGLHEPADLVTCEALTRLVGMGSTEQAFTTMVEMLKHEADTDSDVRAYLETCGLVSEGATLEKRLTDYAAAHFVDDRTARRRSDRGAEALATLFRDEEVFMRPWGHLVLYQNGPLVFPTVALHMDPAAEYQPPTVWINDEIQDLEFDFNTFNEETGRARAGWHLSPVPMTPDAQWLFKIDVEWRMGVWPQWVLAAQLADNRLVAKIQTQRNFMTEATVTWGNWPGWAGIARDEPFTIFPHVGTSGVKPSIVPKDSSENE